MASSASAFALADPAERDKITEQIEKLKNDPEGWRTCIEIITKEVGPNFEEHFLLLKVIEDYLIKRYAKDVSGRETVCMWMSHWIRRLSTGEEIPSFLLNKMAHLFALVFAADFPLRWPRFIHEVFLQHSTSLPIVMFLLRTLVAIDSEVVDREIQRSKEVFDRNALIKDAMRELCIKDLASLWCSLLGGKFEHKADKLCLEVMARYIDWIDIDLIANERMMNLLVYRVDSEDGDAAVSAINAVMEKGMDATKKVELASVFFTLLRRNGTLTLEGDYDDEDVTRTGALLASIGTALIDCMNKLALGSDSRAQCVNVLENELDRVLRCLQEEDIYATQTVLDFLRRYVCFLKSEPRTAFHNEFLIRVVCALVARYKAPDDVNLENDGEKEADFLSYRKQIRSVLAAAGVLVPELIISALEPSVTDLCEEWETSEIAPIEATISLVYFLAEMINTNFVTCTNDVSSRAKSLVLQILASDVTKRGEIVVNSVFFEVACRYDKLLLANPNLIPHLMDAFLDGRGLRHPSPRLRTRVVYLFCRFVKSHKQALSEYTGTVLTEVAPLLSASPTSDFVLTSDDQMFLYEATSTLIVYGSLETALKERYMKELVSMLLNKFFIALQQLQAPLQPEQALEIRRYLATVITYSSRITKAFTASCTMQSCGCSSIFMELMNIYLDKVLWEYSEMLDALRQYLHRMAVCLDEQFLPALPSIFSKFLSAGSDLKVLHDFLILVQQIFTKFKAQVMDTGVDISGLFLVVWTVQNMERDMSDENVSRSVCYLNRAYLQTALCVITNDLLAMLSRAGTEFMGRFLTSVLSFCACSDRVAQKVALTVIAKLFLRCTEQSIRAFVEPAWERCTITALQVPLSNQNDSSDAQCVIVQHEASACLAVLRDFFPERFDALITNVLPPNFAQTLIHCLVTLKGRELDKQLDKLYSDIRAHSVSSC